MVADPLGNAMLGAASYLQQNLRHVLGFSYHRVVAGVQLMQSPVRLPGTLGNRIKPRFAGQYEGAGNILRFGTAQPHGLGKRCGRLRA